MLKVHKLGLFGVIVPAVLATSLLSCGGNTDEPSRSQVASESPAAHDCNVGGIPQEFVTALCSGDGDGLRKAIFDFESHHDRSTYESLIRVLHGVWRRDESVGRGLPWKELESAATQTTLVDTLAQAVRNQDIDIPMEDLQTSARRLLNAQRHRDQFQAIRLLGLTNSAADVPLLKRIAESDDPSSRRRNAIEALGYICDPSSAQALQDLRITLARNETDAMLVEKALEARTRLKGSWCRTFTR